MKAQKLGARYLSVTAGSAVAVEPSTRTDEAATSTEQKCAAAVWNALPPYG